MSDATSSTPVPTPVPTPAALRPPVTAPASDPGRFGRIADDGTVYLQAPEGEIVVGQWAAGTPAEGLAFFARKYDDLVTEIDLIAKRIGDGRANAEQAQIVLAKVREGLAARSFVGDVRALQAKCDAVESAIATARAAAAEARAESRARAAVVREALAAEAERLSTSTAWKATTERFAAMVEEWKTLPHADRATEQALWKRLSGARATFDKARRAHFAELDTVRKSAVARKRELIAQAETLSQSSDWATAGRKLRDLMTDWKAAPRGSKTDEDKLWRRFKAAQDAFYERKSASEAAVDDALRPNVPAKEALVVEAEALLPITDGAAAKRSLRSIQDRWEKAGDIPRADRDRLERRLKRVEESLRQHESDAWRRTNPEARARAESTANAFSAGMERLQAQLDAARAKGDAGAVAKLESQLEQTQALLAAAQAAASEFSR